jgi:hypothetical protein
MLPFAHLLHTSRSCPHLHRPTNNGVSLCQRPTTVCFIHDDVCNTDAAWGRERTNSVPLRSLPGSYPRGSVVELIRGLNHENMRRENMRWNHELQRIMLIGFEKAYLTVDISSWEGSRLRFMSLGAEDKTGEAIDHSLGMYRSTCHPYLHRSELNKW